MPRDSNSNAGKSRRDEIGNAGLLWKNQRERPRPEGLDQLPGGIRNMRYDFIQLGDCRDMNNQRIKRRPLLRIKDTSHRPRICRVSTEPIDCLRRKRDQFALLQQRGGFLNID